MKTSAFIPQSGVALLLAALAAQPLWAQDATKSSILQNQADQQDVSQHTTALAQQLQGLIDELSNNGISGDDAKVLQTTKAVLNSLTAQEMQRVINSLQKAGAAAGTQAGEQSLVQAYGDQKGIIMEFRQILKDYEQRQAADELPAKFKELTDRQTQVMWTTAQVATEIGGKDQGELNTMQQTTAQIVQTDQNALVNDVAMAKQMLDKAAQDATGDQGRAMQQAQKDLADGKLQAALDKANADLQQGHLLQATSEQKAARDQLRQLAKDLNPPTSTADALADFAATLNQIIDEEKDLLTQTNAADGVQPRVVGLDTKQGILVDKTNSLSDDMQALSPAPAGMVKDAIQPMQIARAALGPRGGPFVKAAASEQDAIDKLEAAAKSLQQQVADAEKAQEDAAKDSTQKLQDLQNQIQQAMQQQQQTTQQTANANAQTPPDQNTLNQAQQQQSALQQQAQQMQQAAAPLSLPASQDLANAQQAMSQAQQAMSQGNAQQTQQAQQQAQQDLAQANQAVGQQLAQDQQQQADSSQLAQAANQLQQAQTDVSNAAADAQQQSGQQQSSSAQQPQGGQQQASAQQQGGQDASQQQQSGGQPDMQQAQQALAQAAQATQAAAATPGLPDAAQQAVGQAQQDIAQGQQAAQQGNAAGTESAAQAAQSALAQAQAAVAVAQAGMTPSSQMAGGPPTPGSGPPMPGPPMPGMPSSAMEPPHPDTPSKDGAKNVSGGSTDKGTLHGVAGNGRFITVQSRERTAIAETQGENRPQEYAPMIDQYLKNLSDQSSTSSQ